MAQRPAHQPLLSFGFVTLQEILGHEFSNADLLTRALTHASYGRANYERLEFLGDRVLALVIAEYLSELYPEAEEGQLAKSLAALVARDSLAGVARRLDLGAHIRVAADVGGRDNPSILSDACEALIAALYLDGGLDVARNFIRANWQDLIDTPPGSGDAKTQLQEWSQARGLGLPVYVEKGREGPDHALSFLIEVQVTGQTPQSASGTSKRAAERAAAEAMLKMVKNHDN